MQFEIDAGGLNSTQTKKDPCDVQESFSGGGPPILNEVDYFAGWS